MIIAKKLALLGRIHTLKWEGEDEIYLVEWPESERAIVCCNGAGTAIYIIPENVVATTELKDSRSRVALMFEAFNGFEVNERSRVEVEEDNLRRVGEALECEYYSDKFDGEERLYVHTFEEPAQLYNDNDDDPQSWGILHDRGLRLVTERGIIG